ncbi:hypothetical protein D6D00_00127 [Aureobasidium pullulans]|uniref:Uncharacterized protein n=1 Tax=Aureobasidium pullulans TaxID=5580 RepID=A0A4S8S4Y1_AURPU|nr:hypothetical protein D6D28_09311 [Aureobasidium pullulans]THY34759.1 hypothetical protein D6D00_00127 [Aureobasidium pullulans]
MFFAKTIVAAFAVVGSVSALPVQKRDDAVIGDPANPLGDLLTNVQGGLRGGLDFLSIPSGSSKTKRDDAVIGDPASALSSTTPAISISHTDTMQKQDPLDDLLTNVQGGLRGGLDFLSIPSGSSDKKKRDVIGDAANPLDDLLTNVDSGVEGFFDFLGAGGKKE